MKKKHTTKPGANVGEQTPKDDSAPLHQKQRELTLRTSPRGRTEPRGRATPPQKRSST